MTTLEEAYQKMVEIREAVRGNIDQILTEEDAKIQIINRVLTECLGWGFANIGAERVHEAGWSCQSKIT